MLIEFDGIQHYQAVEYFGGEEVLKQQQLRDSIKSEYAKDNGIELIRIPYWETSNIREILDNVLTME